MSKISNKNKTENIQHSPNVICMVCRARKLKINFLFGPLCFGDWDLFVIWVLIFGYFFDSYQTTRINIDPFWLFPPCLIRGQHHRELEPITPCQLPTANRQLPFLES